MLFSICQRYNFESKSQLATLHLPLAVRCFRYVKDTILKANHNYWQYYWWPRNAVFDMSKIQFWKQITTTTSRFAHYTTLFSICQRYNFESKSQLKSNIQGCRIRCFRYVKDTILKANHNFCVFPPSFCQAVFDMSKIQFWKQITTTSQRGLSKETLFSICQRYNFESKSQLSKG